MFPLGFGLGPHWTGACLVKFSTTPYKQPWSFQTSVHKKSAQCPSTQIIEFTNMIPSQPVHQTAPAHPQALRAGAHSPLLAPPTYKKEFSFRPCYCVMPALRPHSAGRLGGWVGNRLGASKMSPMFTFPYRRFWGKPGMV